MATTKKTTRVAERRAARKAAQKTAAKTATKSAKAKLDEAEEELEDELEDDEEEEDDTEASDDTEEDDDTEEEDEDDDEEPLGTERNPVRTTAVAAPATDPAVEARRKERLKAAKQARKTSVELGEVPTREVPGNQHVLEGTPPINARDERARLAAAPHSPQAGPMSSATSTTAVRPRRPGQAGPAVQNADKEPVMVVANRIGYYDHKRRSVGETFAIRLGKEEPLPTWVDAIEDDAETMQQRRTPSSAKTRVTVDTVI